MKFYDLSGEWNLLLDPNKEQTIDTLVYNDTITLPATTAMAGKGTLNTKRETGFLTELYPFEGYAWYSRKIRINSDELNCRLFVSLERTRLTKLWIDGVYAGECNSLNTSHRYEITDLVKNTEFEITVLVANTDYPTKGGHLTSPDTQTNWNGILGEISLTATGSAAITNVFAESDIENKQIHLNIEIDSTESWYKAV